MKFQAAVKTKLIQFFAAVCLMLAPVVSFGQPPLPDDGGEPIGPDAPFDANMSLIFLAVGLLFAAVVIVKRLRKKAVA